METARVESQRVGFFRELLAQVKAEVVGLVVRPDSNSSVSGTRSEDLFLNTDIKANDAFAVETGDQVLKLVDLIGSLQIDLHFQDLVGVGTEQQGVLFRVNRHVGDLVVHHVVVQNFVLALVVLVRHLKVVSLSSLVRHSSVDL